VISREEIAGYARKALGLTQSVNVNVAALGGRGSDRAFYRLTWETDSAILIHYNPVRIENAYYGDIALFLDKIHVPVPQLLHHDADQCLMIMEDLGDNDLWSFRNEPWDIRRMYYRKALEAVHRFHSFAADQFPSAEIRLMDPFGEDLYRWERDYFRVNFVDQACRIDLPNDLSRKLEEELSALAHHIHSGPRSLVHRDLQSQNIMIRNNEPYFIDFQGMRFGSPFYDLGSLLCDPYVSFSGEEREELLSYYYGLSSTNLAWTDFEQFFWEASAQRLMQALGAYGFLGLKKGLPAFLEHIPSGLANLRYAASRVPALACLRELLRECRKTMGNG